MVQTRRLKLRVGDCDEKSAVCELCEDRTTVMTPRIAAGGPRLPASRLWTDYLCGTSWAAARPTLVSPIRNDKQMADG